MRRLKLAFYDWTRSRNRTRAPNGFWTNGVVEVPDFLDAKWSGELQRVVNRIYSELAAARDAGAQAFLAKKELAYHFTSWSGVSLEPLPSYLEVANPELASDWNRVLDHISGQTRRVFDPNWRLIPKRSWFRRHIGMTNKVPWHIDADAAAVAGFGREAFNVWMPLEPVGQELPSLDVIPGSHKVLRDMPLLKAPDLYRDDDFAYGIGAASTPRLEPGDALIFDQYTLHRTQQAGSEDCVRTACEFRFARQ